MSHFTTVHTQLKDAAALAAACQELGVELLDHAVARGYGSNQHKGDYVIRLRGPYDVALNRQTDGSYAITTDYWGGHVARELGADCGRLKQLYAVHRTLAEARLRGLATQRHALPNGQVRLTLTQV